MAHKAGLGSPVKKLVLVSVIPAFMCMCARARMSSHFYVCGSMWAYVCICVHTCVCSLSGNIRPQSSEPLWTDPGIKS